MTTIDPTAGTFASQAAAQPDSQPTALRGLGPDGFLELLVAQLRYQSPDNPSDPTALLQQTSQLAQVETMQQVAETQQQLMSLQQTGIASGFVGREVSTVDADGNTTEGVVEAVRFASSGPVLVVDGTEIPLAQATEVRAAGD